MFGYHFGALSTKFLTSILVMLVVFVYKEEFQKKKHAVHAVDEFIDDVPLPMWYNVVF